MEADQPRKKPKVGGEANTGVDLGEKMGELRGEFVDVHEPDGFLEADQPKVGEEANDGGEKMGELRGEFVEVPKLKGAVQNVVYDFAKIGLDAQISSAYKNRSEAGLYSFFQQMRHLEKRWGSTPNFRLAYLPLSESAVTRFISDGVFRTTSHRICLYPAEFPRESLQSSTPDDKGLLHLVMCGVIMGRMELVPPDSEQSGPSSEEYDSGVDDLSCPKKYFVWKCYMHTHIYPEYVFSLKISKLEGEMIPTFPKELLSPTSSSPSPFYLRIPHLVKVLPLDSLAKLRTVKSALQEKKITGEEAERKIRDIAGKNLIRAVESFHEKDLKDLKAFDILARLPTRKCSNAWSRSNARSRGRWFRGSTRKESN